VIRLKRSIEESQKEKNDLLQIKKNEKELIILLANKNKIYHELDQESKLRYLKLSRLQQKDTQELIDLLPDYEKHEQAFHEMQEKYLDHESKVSITSLEIFLLSFVFTSMFVGVFVGLNVASSGIAMPILISILAIGVLGGLYLKYSENKDEKLNGAIYQGWRTFAIDMWNKVRCKKQPASLLENQHVADRGDGYRPISQSGKEKDHVVDPAQLVWLGVKEQQPKPTNSWADFFSAKKNKGPGQSSTAHYTYQR
jgi:hypothetical protein